MPSDYSGDEESNYEPSPTPGDRDNRKEKTLTNMPYDEALELSQDSTASSLAEAKGGGGAPSVGAKGFGDDGKSGLGGGGEERLTNNPFDEACDLDDEDDSVDTTEGLQQKMFAAPKKEAPRPGAGAKAEPARRRERGVRQGRRRRRRAAAPAVEGAYNAKDYSDLNVSADVRDLFQYIGRYNAHEVELDSTLKCFIPDYIPAVGEMDAFIKVPRPDGERDELGLQVLDEPAAAQSDATVLELQLRAVSKKQHGDVAIRSIEHAAKNPLEIERWIKSIEDLHRSKPPPQVNYRKAMPDIDKLMEEWPSEFEDMLRGVALPTADLECSLPELARIACSIMDIPVYDNLVESLHVLFSVYLEFSDNVHFAAARTAPPQGA
ncbi:intraflagellar transport-like protein [Aureococcus anophagefferens]|uniref:Intraflagellar transport-like protein n=1 Tax=Aureococcus anophagefferens TaxID=44056 RepID=A0ABR1G2T3_AURAN